MDLTSNEFSLFPQSQFLQQGANGFVPVDATREQAQTDAAFQMQMDAAAAHLQDDDDDL